MTSPIVFDTDIQLHRIGNDPKVSEYLEELRIKRAPIAISSFSKVELKGNYIQDLLLLRHKTLDSDNIAELSARVQNTGGRRCTLMLAQLFKWLGGAAFPVNPWEPAKRQLLTHIDSQVRVCWDTLTQSVDAVLDELRCTRADEAPHALDGTWTATIPRCEKHNTTCNVVTFVASHLESLDRLKITLESLPERTDELDRILRVITETLATGQFPWRGSTCRSVGDLLIGLQSKSVRGIISSNLKEHGVLHGPLGYRFEKFEYAQIRIK